MTQDPQQDPSRSAETPAEPADAKEEPVAVGEMSPSADELAGLNAEVAAAKEESAQWRDRFLRKAAELENFRKRTERDRVEAVIVAKSAVLTELLQVADGFERALASLDSADDGNSGMGRYRDGIELLHRQLMDIFQRLGVKPLQAVGRSFDPHFHEALSRLQTTEHAENTVVRELRRGYLFHDRLLRPAQVVVSMLPLTESRPEA